MQVLEKRNISLKILYLISILSFPVFGGQGGGEVLANLYVLFMSLLFVSFKRLVLSQADFYIICFFLILQLLLVPAFLNDITLNIASIADLPSLFRPTFMLFAYLGFRALFSNDEPYRVLKCFCFAAFFVLFVFLCFQIAIPNYVDLIARAVYFDTRTRGFVFLSFFGKTYFAAYFYFIILLFFLIQYVIFRTKVALLPVVISLMMIFFSQSKTAYFASVLAIVLAVYLTSKPFFKSLVVIILSSIILIFVVYFETFIEVISRSDYFSLKQLSLLFRQGVDSAIIGTRLEQIYQALSYSLENLLLGVGLGRHVYLESFIATFSYRYGLIGLALYVVFFFLIIKGCLFYNKKNLGKKESVVIVYGAVWFSSIPFIMLSNPMFEMGKNSSFSMFLLSIVIMQFNDIKVSRCSMNLSAGSRVVDNL